MVRFGCRAAPTASDSRFPVGPDQPGRSAGID